MGKVIRLIIEDGDLALWRPINNVFTWNPSWNPETDEVPWDRHWNGLLVQIGEYVQFPKGHKKSIRTFVSLQFEDEGGRSLKTTLPEDFEWLDIQSGLHDRRQVAMKGVGPGSGSPFIQGFLETHSFKPEASITFWHNRNGYDISVREHYLAGRRTASYEFTLPEVDQIHINGEELDEEVMTSVSRIIVNAVRNPWGPGGPILDPPPDEP